MRTQRDPFQVERRLSDLAVRDRGVVLLEKLDLEFGELRHLPPDHAESALYVLP